MKAHAHTGNWRPASAEDYQDWEEENQVFEGMAYWSGTTLTVKHDGRAQLIEGQRVSASLFFSAGGAADPRAILSTR